MLNTEENKLNYIYSTFYTLSTSFNVISRNVLDKCLFQEKPTALYTMHSIHSCNVLDTFNTLSLFYLQVPIVKLTDKDTEIRVDISFNVANSVKSAELIMVRI